MDTLTHALSGALVARWICAAAPAAVTLPASAAAPALRSGFAKAWRAGAGSVKPWQAVVVGLVAGAFPDIDAVSQSVGDFAYLRHHRGITHSLLLAPVWAALLALLLAPLWARTRGMQAGWKPLFPLTLAAILAHIAGDWITQFGTMLLAPLSDQRFGLGAMFIIDLSFTGILLAALLLCALWRGQRWPAALGVAAAAAWVGLAWVGQQEALAVGHAHAAAQGIRAQWVDTMPRPASPFNWTVTVFDGQTYHLAHINTRRSQALVAGPEDNFVRRFSAPYLPVAQAQWQQVAKFGAPDTAAWAQQAWEHPAFATYRWFAQSPALVEVVEVVEGVAGVEGVQPTKAGGKAERCAVFRDLRFEFPGRGESPFRFGLCLDGQGAARVVKVQDGVLLPAN